jgi:hypothetical protein
VQKLAVGMRMVKNIFIHSTGRLLDAILCQRHPIPANINIDTQKNAFEPVSPLLLQLEIASDGLPRPIYH